MAVVAADFVFPPDGTGELQPDWFPGQDLSVLLATWIGQGESAVPAGATTEQADAVTLAHVYRTAYRAIVRRMAGDPGSSSIGGGAISEAYRKDQLDRFAEEAAAWDTLLTEALAAVVPVVTVAVVESAPRVSFSQPISVAF